MKKLLLFGLLGLNAISFASPRCLGHQTSKFKSPSRKSPLELVDCSCPCQNYPRSHHADGYKCLICDHRLLPSQIQASNQESNDDVIPITDAFIRQAVVASTQRFYNEKREESKQQKPSKKSADAWMTI